MQGVGEPTSILCAIQFRGKHWALSSECEEKHSLKSNAETCCSLHFNSVHNRDIEARAVKPQQGVTQSVVSMTACLPEPFSSEE